MREIKFRAWDTNSKKMFDCSKIQDYSLEQVERLNSANDPYTKFMQYTGLKDKNDVGIYEHMELDNTYEVSFLNGSYVLTNISNGDIMLLSNYMENNNGKVEITREYTKV